MSAPTSLDASVPARAKTPPTPPGDFGRLGISEGLRRFVAEMPSERGPILYFVMRAAAACAPRSRVADVGAGEAPYAELFDHVDYVTVDWSQSPHSHATPPSLTASIESLPVQDGAFDAVLLTQVLEHVPDPVSALRELHRVLVPGGLVYVTVPLAWELHELPHDYYRYTEPGLRHVLNAAGFEVVELEARGDCFTTLAQLMRNVCWAMGAAADGLDSRRASAREALETLADRMELLAPLDAARRLPLGYQAVARRPSIT
jgi:SAM-dependent methyltransferase